MVLCPSWGDLRPSHPFLVACYALRSRVLAQLLPNTVLSSAKGSAQPFSLAATPMTCSK